MTKPKIANGHCLNPIARLEKRMEECKRRHNDAIKKCINTQEAHNKSNSTLKALLERKAKQNDGKTKKKRSTNASAVTRKKPKLSELCQQKTQAPNFFRSSEPTPNVNLSIPNGADLELDLDMLEPGFPAIDEQELEGVLNNSCMMAPASGGLGASSGDSTLGYNQETIEAFANIDAVINGAAGTTIATSDSIKKEDCLAPPPMFPPPENPSQLAHLPYNTVGSNSSNNSAAASVNSNNNLNYNMPVPASQYVTEIAAATNNTNPPPACVSTTYNYQYQHTNSTVNNNSMSVNNNSNQNNYFYSAYPSTNYSLDPTTLAQTPYQQLPAMSSGWYNNDNSHIKPAITTTTTLPASNNTNNHFPKYPANFIPSHTSYPTSQPQPQMTNFNHPYVGNPNTLVAPTTFVQHLPQQQAQPAYYYVDNSAATNFSHLDPRYFTANTTNNTNTTNNNISASNAACRNFYTSNCMPKF